MSDSHLLSPLWTHSTICSFLCVLKPSLHLLKPSVPRQCSSSYLQTTYVLASGKGRKYLSFRISNVVYPLPTCFLSNTPRLPHQALVLNQGLYIVMRKSSSNASSRRGPSGHPGHTQRGGRPASTEQKSLSTSDRESKERGPDDMEMMSGPMTSESYTSLSPHSSSLTRFTALPPKVPAPGTPEEPSQSQSLRSDSTFLCELRQTKSPRTGKSSNAQASSFMLKHPLLCSSILFYAQASSFMLKHPLLCRGKTRC